MLIDTSTPTPGLDLVPIQRRLVNRTGTTLVPGSLVAFNLDFAATAGQAMTGINPSDSTDGATGYVYGAAIAPTTANIRKRMAVVDWNGPSVPDNAEFTAYFAHPRAKVLIEPSSGAGQGEWLVGTNGQYYATGQTDAELGGTAAANATDIVKVLGQLLEAGPTGSSAATKTVEFWGGLTFAGLVCKGGAT